jgi:mono/diheme cytochrome c family protein
MRSSISLALVLVSCAAPAPPSPAPDRAFGVRVEAEPQRPGDPAEGYRRLLHEGYVGCGVPMTAYRRVFGRAAERDRLPGRTGSNAWLPFDKNAFTVDGVEVVSANCLTCHASRLDGELIIGLGNARADYTGRADAGASLARALVRGPKERAAFDRWHGRLRAVAPHLQTQARGANPANNLAAALFAHRDPETLAWSDAPLLEPPSRDPLPVDVPPWWRAARKHALYATGAGRGDHARLMMTASTLCVDNVEDARAIDDYFPDIAAYIRSIEPPAWPGDIDDALARRGRDLFEESCADCHGTYGARPSYPNLVVPLDEVETDPLLATQDDARFRRWFNSSWYGEEARLVDTAGYVAPPLDGVWATAPFLHNGSVPTLRALLDSETRPARWRREDRYDRVDVGWAFTTEAGGAYDTGRPGHSNQGHTYGDVFTDDERAAVLEYLRTL